MAAIPGPACKLIPGYWFCFSLSEMIGRTLTPEPACHGVTTHSRHQRPPWRFNVGGTISTGHNPASPVSVSSHKKEDTCGSAKHSRNFHRVYPRTYHESPRHRGERRSVDRRHSGASAAGRIQPTEILPYQTPFVMIKRASLERKRDLDAGRNIPSRACST